MVARLRRNIVGEFHAKSRMTALRAIRVLVGRVLSVYAGFDTSSRSRSAA